MPDAPSLFEQLYELDGHLLDAIGASDVETVSELAAHRQELIDAMQRFDAPSEIAPDWKDAGKRVAVRHAEVIEKMEAFEQRLSDEIRESHKIQSAGQQYHSEPHSKRSVLRGDVRG